MGWQQQHSFKVAGESYISPLLTSYWPEFSHVTMWLHRLQEAEQAHHATGNTIIFAPFREAGWGVSSPGVSITKYRALGGLNTEMYRDQKSKVKVLAGLVPSEGSAGEPAPGSSPRFGDLGTIVHVPWLVEASAASMLSSSRGFLTSCVCSRVPCL